MKLRLLPAAILVATTLLGVKLTSLWHGIESVVVAQPALAQSAAQPAQAQSAATPQPAAAPQRRGADLADDPTLMSQSEIDLLQKLAARRAEIETWDRDLDLREKLLKAAEQRFDKKLAELQDVQESIKAMLKQHDDEQEAKLKSLVKIYETMKAKDAAVVFEKLDMDVLLDVIERMKETKVAPVLAAMNPDKAKTLTEDLAGRRRIAAEAVAKKAAQIAAEPAAAAPAQGPVSQPQAASAAPPAQPVAGMIPPPGNPPPGLAPNPAANPAAR